MSCKTPSNVVGELDSSVVARCAVNRWVLGSDPASGYGSSLLGLCEHRWQSKCLKNVSIDCKTYALWFLATSPFHLSMPTGFESMASCGIYEVRLSLKRIS